MKLRYYIAIAALLILASMITACARKSDAGYVEIARDKPEVYNAGSDLPVVQDPETGCQYIGYTSHGLTPRLAWDEKRQEMMPMGCRIVEHE